MSKLVSLTFCQDEVRITHPPLDARAAPPQVAMKIAEQVEALRKKLRDLKVEVANLNQEAQQQVFPWIRQAFEEAECIDFLARPHNIFHYREVGVGDIGIIRLDLLLSALEIDARRLQKKFGGFAGAWDDYESLNSFPLVWESFVDLATFIKKPIRVYREFRQSEHHGQWYLFTAHPDGRVETAQAHASV